MSDGKDTKVQSSSSLNNALIAHYKFEGNANDSSGNNNHGIERDGVIYPEVVSAIEEQLRSKIKEHATSFYKVHKQQV